MRHFAPALVLAAVAACGSVDTTPNATPLQGNAMWSATCAANCNPSMGSLTTGSMTIVDCSMRTLAGGVAVTVRIARGDRETGDFETSAEAIGFDGFVARSGENLTSSSAVQAQLLVRGSGWLATGTPSSTCQIRTTFDESRRAIGAAIECTAPDDATPPVNRIIRGSVSVAGCR